jgi:Flp pilus assembly protein TadD
MAPASRQSQTGQLRVSSRTKPRPSRARNRCIPRGDFHQAIAELDQAIRLDPHHAKAYNIRGNAWDYGDSDRALSVYDEAIRIDPNNPAVFHDRGMMW